MQMLSIILNYSQFKTNYQLHQLSTAYKLTQLNPYNGVHSSKIESVAFFPKAFHRKLRYAR